MDLNKLKAIYDQQIDFRVHWSNLFPNDNVINTHRFERCCPLHQENTPSFKYDESRDIWTCFGSCHTSGKVVKFHQLYLKQETGEDVTLYDTLLDLWEMYQNLPKPILNKEDNFLEWETSQEDKTINTKLPELTGNIDIDIILFMTGESRDV